MPRKFDGENWYDTKEAMQFLGITSRDTLRNYVKTRKVLHPRKQTVGSALWYSERELINLKKLHNIDEGPILEMPIMMRHFDKYIESKGLIPISKFAEDPHFVAAPEDVATLMNVPVGTMIVKRLLSQGGREQDKEVLWRISENWYHPSFVDEAMLLEMVQDPKFDTMLAIKKQTGKTVHNIDIDLTARTPTILEQELLDIAPGEPVIEMWRVNRTAKNGEIVMLQHQTLIGKRTKLTVPLDEVHLWDDEKSA